MKKPIMRSLAGMALLLPLWTGLTGCDKVWELGQKLKAPEQPVVAVESPATPDASPESPGAEPVAATPAAAAADPGTPATAAAAPETPAVPDAPATFNKDAQVSILGYHNFVQTARPTDMKIQMRKFRAQMQALKDTKIPVISMKDYLAWRRGEKFIPDTCVVITIDDGWKAVYTLAYPVLKEFGYPYSIYLYKNYIGVGGDSLTPAQIREMMEHGCEVASHSVSHSDMTDRRGKNDAQYEEFLRDEIGESMRYLKENFGEAVLPVFAYPYGKYNQQVQDLVKEYGYEIAVTVSPKKANYEQSSLELGRYIIHGDNDLNINVAMSFRGASALAASNLASAPAPGAEGQASDGPLITLSPEQNSTITDRLPLVEVNVSKLTGIDPRSIEMEISGLGKVPAEYVPSEGVVRFQLTERLRAPQCRVSVKLQRRGEPKPDNISWTFHVDRKALYLMEPMRATPIEAPAADAASSEGEGKPAA